MTRASCRATQQRRPRRLADALRAMHSVVYGAGVYDVPSLLTVILTLSRGNASCSNRSAKLI
jgi:hypothetical protein